MVRYKYHDYRRQTFASVDELNAILKIALTPGGGIANKIATGFQLAAVIGVMWARSIAIRDEMQIEKQEYELERSGRNKDDIDEDDQD